MLRVFPYGALQFVSYEQYKKVTTITFIIRISLHLEISSVARFGLTWLPVCVKRLLIDL